MKKNTQRRLPRGARDNDRLPVYCDFSCPYAAFAPADAVGACRRDQAVFCTILSIYTPKHSGCKVRFSVPRDTRKRA